MSDALEKVHEFRKRMDARTRKFSRSILNNLLSQLTSDQRDKFNRIFKDGVPESKLTGAIQLCERTVKLNSEMITIRGCEHNFEEGQKFCVECGKPIWITKRNEPSI